MKTAEQLNRREIDWRYSAPWTIIAYYFVKEHVCTIFINDESLGDSVEFKVPNSRVGEEFTHALAHPAATFDNEYEDHA